MRFLRAAARRLLDRGRMVNEVGQQEAACCWDTLKATTTIESAGVHFQKFRIMMHLAHSEEWLVRLLTTIELK